MQGGSVSQIANTERFVSFIGCKIYTHIQIKFQIIKLPKINFSKKTEKDSY